MKTPRYRRPAKLLMLTVGVAASMLIGSVSTTAAARPSSAKINYGIVQDLDDPLLVTAAAYPSFTSSQVSVSTATFTFLVPTGTALEPSVPLAPNNSGHLIDINGSWSAMYITPQLWASAGFDPADLEGYDVYQMTLAPGSIDKPAGGMTAGQPFPLFQFRLPDDCSTGEVRMLVNNESIRNAMLDAAGFNANNQFSVSVDNGPSTNSYDGNDPVSSALACGPLRPADTRSSSHGRSDHNRVSASGRALGASDVVHSG